MSKNNSSSNSKRNCNSYSDSKSKSDSSSVSNSNTSSRLKGPESRRYPLVSHAIKFYVFLAFWGAPAKTRRPERLASFCVSAPQIPERGWEFSNLLLAFRVECGVMTITTRCWVAQTDFARHGWSLCRV